MNKLTLDYSKTFITLNEEEILSMQDEVIACHNTLHNKNFKKLNQKTNKTPKVQINIILTPFTN